MEIAKITSPYQHITIKVCHWDSMRSASTIAHFIISLLSIAVRDILVFIFTIVWFIWASTAQQQQTVFWHCGRSAHHQNRVFWQAPVNKLTEIAARKLAKLPFPKFLQSVPGFRAALSKVVT
jgi:hypothetical protein